MLGGVWWWGCDLRCGGRVSSDAELVEERGDSECGSLETRGGIIGEFTGQEELDICAC